MKDLKTLEKDFQIQLEIVDKQMLVAKTMIKDTLFGDIEANINFNYDGLRINLAHKDYNWTDFVNITIERNRMSRLEQEQDIDKRFYIDFSHSSGGWNKGVSVKNRLYTTKNIFIIVEAIMLLEDKLQEPLITFFKEQSSLYAIRKNIEQIEEQNKIKKEHESLKSNYILATFKNIVEDINQNKNITLYYATKFGVKNIKVENRSTSRLNIYVNGTSISKKGFELMFSDNAPLYV